MKLNVLTLVGLLLSGFAVAADDESNSQTDADDSQYAVTEMANLPEASSEMLDELKKECKTFAEEDGVSSAKLSKYLLDCVNQELDIIGYKQVKKL